jgi:hypothetical protein
MSESSFRTKIRSVGLIHFLKLGELGVKPIEMAVDFSNQILVRTHQGTNLRDTGMLLLDFGRFHQVSSAPGRISKVNRMTVGGLDVLDQILSGEMAGMFALTTFRQMVEGQSGNSLGVMVNTVKIGFELTSLASHPMQIVRQGLDQLVMPLHTPLAVRLELSTHGDPSHGRID